MSESDHSNDLQRSAGDRAGGSVPKMSGTVIRGADGKLYFIPDEDIVSYHITDAEDQQTLENYYLGLTDDLQTSVDARRVAAPITNVFHNHSYDGD